MISLKTGMDEQELLSRWCDIFKYDDNDKLYFNSQMNIMGKGENGVLQVFESLNQVCHDGLNGGDEKIFLAMKKIAIYCYTAWEKM